jgi:hypothetical protein
MSGVLGVLAGSVSGGPTATLSAATYESFGVTATMTFNSDGTFTNNVDGGYTWLLSGSAADCKLVYSITSGTFTTSAASGSNMGSNLTFTRGATPGNAQTVVANFSIQRVSDSVTIAGPVAITLTCDNT